MLKLSLLALAMLAPATCQGPDYDASQAPAPSTESPMPYDNSSLVTEIRWGDQQTLTVPPRGIAMTSGQLVRVDREHPETWTIALFAQVPPGLVFWDVTVRFQVIFGAGSSQVSFDAPPGVLSGPRGFGMFMSSAFPVFPAVEDYLNIQSGYETAYRTIELPAMAMQVTARVTNNDVANPISVQVGAFAAPRFYPPIPPGQDKPTRWMPPGFNPTPTHY
jgi:hypothetical protein